MLEQEKEPQIEKGNIEEEENEKSSAEKREKQIQAIELIQEEINKLLTNEIIERARNLRDLTEGEASSLLLGYTNTLKKLKNDLEASKEI